MRNKETVLFIADSSFFSKIASDCVAGFFPCTRSVFWEYGHSHTPCLDDWEGDWIFSFKSDLVLPPRIFRKAAKAAINFHPGPPKYRGIGGYFWAIHNEDKMYGVTCHHIIEKIDYGPIIACRHFPVLEGETALTLKMRAGIYCLELLNDILEFIIQGKDLPLAGKTWGPKLYTRDDLKNLLQHYYKSENLG